MKKSVRLLYIQLFILLVCPGKIMSQFYNAFSRYAGGNAVEEMYDLQVIDGYAYLLGTTRSANFPVTNGTTYRGNLDITLSKYSPDGQRIFSSYIGGLGNDFPVAMKIVQGSVYISLYTDSILFPVTNGSTFRGRRDIAIQKFLPDGSIGFATYLGGSGQDVPAFGGMHVQGSQIILCGSTSSVNFPVTDGGSYHGGPNDGYAMILDTLQGQVLHSRLLGGSEDEFIRSAQFDDTSMYIIGASNSNDIQTSIGSAPPDTMQNGILFRLRFQDLQTLYARYVAGTERDYITQSALRNGMLHISGYTNSPDFPVTNQTQLSQQANDYADAFYTRLAPDGRILYSTLLSTSELDFPEQILFDNEKIYIGATAVSTLNGQLSVSVFQILQNGLLGYQKKLIIGTNRNNPVKPNFQAFQNELMITGITQSPLYPKTDNSVYFTGGTGFFSKLGLQGQLMYSSYLGSMQQLLPAKRQDTLMYLLAQTNQSNYPVTDSSVYQGGSDQILMILQTDGRRRYTAYLGGSQLEIPAALYVKDNEIWMAGKTLSNNYPVTVNERYRAAGDQFLTKFEDCPAGYYLENDTVSPSIQSVCKQGIGQTIQGRLITVPGDSLPPIYRNGVLSLQIPIYAVYQWQQSTDPGGPWTDIPGAVFTSYTPQMGASDLYFRRKAYTLNWCGEQFLHFSDTALAAVNNLTAATVDAGGPFITCPGFPVTLGGSPTATGGNPPYTDYHWQPALPSLPNPMASPISSSVYTVTVTDTLGCVQAAQATVFTFRAQAGPDAGVCAGTPVRIGTVMPPGFAGFAYSWSPSTGLSSDTLAQPEASPTQVTNYILSMQLLNSDSLNCQTLDTVRVTPVPAPLNSNMAGPDQVFCLGSTALLGSVAEPGFQYVWSPGSYINSNTSSFTSYYAGDLVMPVPNPAVMQVTAQQSGCSFSDQAIVSTIEARAGRDGCGPRIIGLPDRTPNLTEIYSWEKISGPGQFTGPQNLPQVPVSASVDSPTVYRLTVTYNGYACTDEITVPPFCTNCSTIIEADAAYTCPSYSVNGGHVTLIAYSSIPNAQFRWTPEAGLNTYVGNTVQLTDNIPRVFTVTAFDPLDSLTRCTDQILVNDPFFVKPVFPAPDTATCSGQPVQIGQPPVAGYQYQWTGTGLSSNLISNPVATVTQNTAYQVTVTDTSGCILNDTVTVIVQNAEALAGPDQIICAPGIVRLGSAAQPGISYIWEPQTAPWQNNTNANSAQPEVLVISDQVFTLQTNSTAGCSQIDSVQVFVNANPLLPDAPDTATCQGIAVRIGAPAIPGVIYQWSPSTGLNNPNLAEPLANPTQTTQYTLNAIFPGGCTLPATDQVTVTVRSAFFSMPDISFCPSGAPFPLGTQAPPNMASYSWQPAAQVSNPAIANPFTLNPPPKNLSTYTLLVTDSLGCRHRDTLQAIPVLAAPQAGPDRVLCKADSSLLGTTANIISPEIRYQWDPPAFLSDPLIPNPWFHASQGGTFTYILTKTDTILNCFSKDTIVITVQDIDFSLNNSPVTCQNSCLIIGTNPVPGIQYQWSPTAGLSDPFIANPVACVGTQNLIYTLQASNLNGCQISKQVVIGVSPLPAAQIQIPPVTGCAGDTSLQIIPQIQPAGPYRYQWSPNDGSLSDTRVANPYIRVALPGSRTYQLHITDTLTGCTNLATALVQINTCSNTVVLGDFIWFDSNRDGLQDAAEQGMIGLRVELYDAAGTLIDATVTDATGYYYFTSVQPGPDYRIRFSKPPGFEYTEPLVGGAQSSINSKANDSGYTERFTVINGQDILNLDAGLKLEGTVPVSWLAFQAVVQNRKVILNWQTASEWNNAWFVVEKSTNGWQFQAIGRVAGQGNAHSINRYQWTDHQPGTGILYYRIRQEDSDGRMTFTHVEAVNLLNDNGYAVQYHEGSHELSIYFEKPPFNTQARLIAINGQFMGSARMARGERILTLRIPKLATGIYTLWIQRDQLLESIQVRLGN